MNGSVFAWVLAGGLLLFEASPLAAQSCPTIPTPGGPVTGIINTYYPGLGTVAAGATQFSVNMNATAGLGANIVAGDMLIVMQMQDADIDRSNDITYGNGSTGSGQTALNNAGRYEYVIARNSVAVGSGTSVTLQVVGASIPANGLLFSYRTAAFSAGSAPANGQRVYQVIKVAKYQNATVGGVTATPWNGVTGGVVAIDASGTLTVNGTGIDVSGDGFRGAPGAQLAGETGLDDADYRRASNVDAHGIKGEGVACTPSNFTGVGATRGCPTTSNSNINGDRARGAPGNGGGGGTDGNPDANDENSGGGGGGNGGSGGRGGNSWLSNETTGGLGGALFPAVVSRMAMGGGGGAGTRNNTPTVANASGGGAGGGIVLVRAGAVAGGTGTPTILASGSPGVASENDGGGGGGAGGTVLVVKQTGTLTALRVLAQGGRGGDSWITEPPNGNPGARHGPGGGGGGGVYFVSSTLAATSSVSGGTTGVTTTALDPYGSSGGVGSINILGNVVITDVPGVVPCITALRASIAGLRSDPSGLVEFVTVQQRATLAFNVYGARAPRLGGALVRLNGAPIVSPVPDSMGPIFYRAVTGRIDFPFVVIEEIERGGHARLMGPFPTSDPKLREDFERLESRWSSAVVREVGAARMVLGDRPTPRRPHEARASEGARTPRRVVGGTGIVSRPVSASTPSGTWTAVKIEVGRAGRVRVPASDLIPWGFPAGPFDGRIVSLTNFGRAVPYQLERDGDQTVALTFASTELSTDYAGANVYVLSWGAAVPTTSVTLTRSELPRLPRMVRVEQNQYYAAYLPRDADPWIWDLLVAGQPAGPWSFDLPGLGTLPQAGPVSVRLRVVGGSDATHVVTASLNGVAFGRLEFTGATTALLRGQVPFSALRATGNTLTLDYPETEGEVGVLYLDCLDVGVTLARDESVVADRISGFDPALPVLEAVEYLIVTHPLFRAQADAVAALKRGEGLSAVVVDVQRAYDHYSGGAVEPNAVLALVKGARLRPRAGYVLLVGDDTYDPRDYTGSGGVSFIPSLTAWDTRFGRVPSENRYADLDGDRLPDVAIGRLPVSTPAEADTLVQKIAEQTSLLSGPPVLAVDNPGPDDVSFRSEAASVEPWLPQPPVWADIEQQGLTSARQTLLDALQAGAGTVSYFGHGGQANWADEHLLGVTDLGSLAGTGRLSVVLAWTCNAQWYQNHLDPSLGEGLILVPQGGAVASFGPAGMTTSVLQAALYSRLYPGLASGLTLGESIRRAKADALRADPAVLEAVEGFSLLGDPALRLPGYTVLQSGGW